VRERGEGRNLEAARTERGRGGGGGKEGNRAEIDVCACLRLRPSVWCRRVAAVQFAVRGSVSASL